MHMYLYAAIYIHLVKKVTIFVFESEYMIGKRGGKEGEGREGGEPRSLIYMYHKCIG